MTAGKPRPPVDPEPADLHILREYTRPDGLTVTEGVRIVKDPTGEITRTQNEAILDLLRWIRDHKEDDQDPGPGAAGEA